MYKHILIPTDGSVLSRHAVTAGVLMAKALGASVLGLHVTPKLYATSLDAWAHGGAGSRSRLRAIVAEHAKEYLSFIEREAKEARVRCQCKRLSASSPYEAILQVAQKNGCDLIFMASHGKKGGAATVLGSETVKVLTHSAIPVMVHRERGAAFAMSKRRGSRRASHATGKR